MSPCPPSFPRSDSTEIGIMPDFLTVTTTVPVLCPARARPILASFTTTSPTIPAPLGSSAPYALSANNGRPGRFVPTGCSWSACLAARSGRQARRTTR